jgi:AraC-like DNA-binding protein
MNRQVSVAAKPVGNERYYSPYIQKAIQYIDKHYDSPISLDILSLEIGVSKYHLSRHCKADTGLSFTQYVNHRRIIEAKRILLNQDVNVSQACYAVGFNELFHFSRVFKQFEKTSPSEFRRMMTAARSLEKESVRSCCY